MNPSTDSLQTLGRDPWGLAEHSPDARLAPLHETLLALGNGRIGVRGAHEEGARWPGTSQDAIYVNGFYDSEDIRYPENAYGLARENQFLVSVPNGKAVAWTIDGEAFDPQTGRIEEYRRGVDFRGGVLERQFTWVSPKGKRVQVHSRRLVCLARPEVWAMQYELQVEATATIAIESGIDARSRSLAASDDPRVGSAHGAQALERIGLVRNRGRIALTHRTRRSALEVVSALAQELHVLGARVISQADCGSQDDPGERWDIALDGGGRIVLTKILAIVTTRDHPSRDLLARAAEQLESAQSAGWDALVAEQRRELERYWHDADVRIDGDDPLQQGIRFNMLHLLQSAGTDGRTNIAAKGVTGSGYDGHYFWDTEIYIFPALLHTRPEGARKLLEYRYWTLDAARTRARELDIERGALFPWRTITGPECSAYFPAGTAQVHLNADIAFAVKRYWEATGDDAFMREQGVELLVETARVWTSIGHFRQPADGNGNVERFEIHTVTGPDEYTAIVDNNFYTNAMARVHLQTAVDAARWLRESHPQDHARVARKIGLADEELAVFARAAAAMHLGYDAARRIHPQDDSFLAKPHWKVPVREIPEDKRPLLLHYHSLVIYRHQVLKQADVVLAMMLLDQQFDVDDKRRDYDYYEPLTTHDSSLSRCIYGIVASEVGYDEAAYRHFEGGVRADLDDHHRNTHHGVHTASMAGSWQGVVAGFGGFRMRGGVPAFSPTLPAAWKGYSFRIRVGAAQVQVAVDANGVSYELVSGERLTLQHRGQPLTLTRETPRLARAAAAAPSQERAR